MASANANLHKAKDAKNDEFYTQLTDIAKQHNPNGSVTSGGKVNTGVALYYTDIPAQRYYTASNCDGYLLRTYGRILIRKKVGA